MLMFDGCCGWKSASAAMKDRGWDVFTLDIEPKFDPDLVADIRQYSSIDIYQKFDLAWFSPPCTEFARESMPWSKTGSIPDMSIVFACMKIIEKSKPRYWIIENVRGASRYLTPFLGKPRKYGPYFLWGKFPDIGKPVLNIRKKESVSSSDPEKRALIPYNLSKAIAISIESQIEMFPEALDEN